MRHLIPRTLGLHLHVNWRPPQSRMIHAVLICEERLLASAHSLDLFLDSQHLGGTTPDEILHSSTAILADSRSEDLQSRIQSTLWIVQLPRCARIGAVPWPTG